MPQADPRIRAILAQLQRLETDARAVGSNTAPDDPLEAVGAGIERLARTLAARTREAEQAKEALDRSEQRWRALVDNAPDCIAFVDPGLRVTFINRFIPDLSPDDWLGKSILETIAAVDREQVREALAGVLRTGDPARLEIRGIPTGGSEAWYAVQAAPVREDGQVSGLVLIGRDVTERHAMVQALTDSEVKYRQLWEGLNDAAFIADAETGVLVEANIQAERLLGYPRERIVGMHQSALHPVERRDEYVRLFRRHVEHGGTVVDVEVLRADGRIVPVDISVAILEMAGHRYAIGLFHDISRRKAIMRELEFTRFAVDHAADAIFWIDDRLRFVHANEQACHSLGYGLEELLGMGVSDISEDIDRERADHYLRRIRGAGHVSRRSTHRRKDGSRFPVEVTANYFHFDGRDYVCAIARDATSREAAERALLERDAKLGQVNRELEQLVYAMAHDLKAPLRAVSQLTSVIEETTAELPAEPQRLLGLIRSRVQRMHALIDALLSYFSVGQVERITTVDAGAKVRSVIDELSAPGGMLFDVADDMPVFESDPVQLRRVFANLIGNAILHRGGEQGHVWVGWRDAGRFYEFTVADDGPGIAPAYREVVFDMLQTLETRDKRESTGIGLALARKLVEAHGGRVSVEEREGGGSLFRFTWPKRLSTDSG